jgi:hypothetical protein
MKNIKTTLAVLLTLTLLGCEEVVLEDDETTTTETLQQDKEGKPIVGPLVNLADYLYPDALVEDKSFIYDKVYSYAQNEQSVFDKAPEIFQRSFTKQKINDTTRINKFRDDKLREYTDISPTKITVYEGEKTPIDLPLRVGVNSVISKTVENRVEKECTVKYLGAKDLLPVLPLYVKNNLKGYLKKENDSFVLEQFNFASVMHVYCYETTNNTTDSYYSKKYGRVLEVKKDIDKNMLKVEVVDVLSVLR